MQLQQQGQTGPTSAVVCFWRHRHNKTRTITRDSQSLDNYVQGRTNKCRSECYWCHRLYMDTKMNDISKDTGERNVYVSKTADMADTVLQF